ncbi:MAG: hypothetical protein ACE5DN_04185, partial [Flavobacteriales bacterium]
MKTNTFISSLASVIIPLGITAQAQQLKSVAPKFNFYNACALYYNNAQAGNYLAKRNEKQFKRWEAFMAPRVYPSGNFEPDILWKTYRTEKKRWDQRAARAYGA